jgi:hypothetical protein
MLKLSDDREKMLRLVWW